jgi:hypothetical protein
MSHKKLESALALVWPLILQWPQFRRLSRLLFVLWFAAQSTLRESFQDMFALWFAELPQ